MNDPRTIEIWEPEAAESETKHALPTFGKSRVKSTEVDLTVLSGNLKEVLADFQTLLDEQPESKSGYYVDEIELSLGVNGKGSVALIGKLEAGMQASIKVKIKRDSK
ncbi:Pepco domain-containing protein [Halomonas sp. N3-2A]|uniref:Pepco domain-containing protein n=1 Tax=Halomonas sp. N3-2A TaxID=2014541 RepID=UPI000B5B124B|nr:hypothetical protein [Halomonas sp. N3-2A]ASK18620.1 hypothetical protein CEK60_04555 [Halomonas sp. N3-2A]